MEQSRVIYWNSNELKKIRETNRELEAELNTSTACLLWEDSWIAEKNLLPFRLKVLEFRRRTIYWLAVLVQGVMRQITKKKTAITDKDTDECASNALISADVRILSAHHRIIDCKINRHKPPGLLLFFPIK